MNKMRTLQLEQVAMDAASDTTPMEWETLKMSFFKLKLPLRVAAGLLTTVLVMLGVAVELAIPMAVQIVVEVLTPTVAVLLACL